MKKIISFVLLTLCLVALMAPVVFAEEAAAAVATSSDAKLKYYGIAALACGIAIGVAAFGASIGQGMGLKGATEGIARNPGASGKITTTMIIGLAMIESLAIYALVVALILLFVNPFKI
jgi:F-type H+-transporting ATPase subunit c